MNFNNILMLCSCMKVRQICHIALKRDHEFINTVEEGSEETHAQVSFLMTLVNDSRLLLIANFLCWIISGLIAIFLCRIISGQTDAFSCSIRQALSPTLYTS